MHGVQLENEQSHASSLNSEEFSFHQPSRHGQLPSHDSRHVLDNLVYTKSSAATSIASMGAHRNTSVVGYERQRGVRRFAGSGHGRDGRHDHDSGDLETVLLLRTIQLEAAEQTIAARIAELAKASTLLATSHNAAEQALRLVCILLLLS